MKTLYIGAFAADPVALDGFHSFDPDSYVAITCIADGLTKIDMAGNVAPNLATAWRRESPTTLMMDLRPGVRFHNGATLTADDVVATFREHLDPQRPSPVGATFFAPIKAVHRVDDLRVRVETHFPDSLLAHRLFCSQIYPAGLLEKEGRDYFLDHPMGTGAFRFVEWQRGRFIRFERNPDHWAQEATVDGIVMPILPRTQWLDCLRRGSLDVLLNIDANDAQLLSSDADIEVKHAPSTLAHYFLFKLEGPTADIRVRRALNLAVHRGLIADVAEHGRAVPAIGIVGERQAGFCRDLRPMQYDPEHARELLAQAGYPDGFALRGLVSASSSAVYLLTREFLARVGVRLEAEIVPRSEWMRRMMSNPSAPRIFQGDFAMTDIDNPILHGFFSHFVVLLSQGPYSLLRSDEYDKRFFEAATTVDPEEAVSKLQALERYVHHEALCLFTVHPEVYLAQRRGVDLPLPASGHFSTDCFWQARMADDVDQSDRDVGSAEAAALDPILSATSHQGIFYLPPDADLDGSTALWRQLSASQDRWFSQMSPMLRELVEQVEARTHFDSVMSSTSRVGIVGYSNSGREMFRNSGYEAMFASGAATLEDLEPSAPGIGSWGDLRQLVDVRGTWEGPIGIGDKRLHLTATRALNDTASPIGYTWVFSDFSGAEERIRSQAIRRILDHVPYGLCFCDDQLVVQPGFSNACSHFFARKGEAIVGSKLLDLLAMNGDRASEYELHYEQVFDEWLPEEVAIAQLPRQVEVEGKTIELNASLISEEGEKSGVLFSMIDATQLHEAQREVSRIRGLVAVMRDRNRFTEEAQAFVATLDALQNHSDLADFEQRARRELHTYKGVWGMFDQDELVQKINALEEQPVLTAAPLRELRQAFLGMIEANFDVWGIRLDDDPDLRLAPGELASLLNAVEPVDDPAKIRETVRAFAAELTKRSVAYLVKPLEATARRVAAREGKDVVLEVAGGEVRVPQRYTPVFRALGHLVRNAICHGIEAPAARGKKPRKGRVEISVQELAEQCVIRFSDDGRGVDLAELVARAIDKGYVGAEDARSLSEADQLQLMFADGLSTADEASDLVGRGVGMGAVRAEVVAAGGTIDVASAAGRGTTVTITLPRASLSDLLSPLYVESGTPRSIHP